MGKRLEDLNLSDAPLPAASPEDVRDTDWYRFCRDIDDLLATGHFTWAESTLTDIQRTVEQYQCVTQGQRNAIANIEAAKERQDGRRRRYEGYSRRFR